MYFKEVTVTVYGKEYTVKVPCEPTTPLERVMELGVNLIKARLERKEKEHSEKIMKKLCLI